MRVIWVAAFGVALAMPLAASAGTLVAPVYPGAVERSATSDAVVYLSKSALPEVRAFYAKQGIKLLKWTKVTPSPEALVALPKAEKRLTAAVLDRKGICAAKAKAGSHAPESMVDGPEAAGVAVGWNSPPQSVDLVPDKTSVFSGFDREVVLQRHSRAEYAALFKKYGWLETAFYPPHKGADGMQPYDRWLVQNTWDRLQAPERVAVARGKQDAQSAVALAKKMQALMQQGRMQEMQQLAQQMAGIQKNGMAAGQDIGAAQKQDQWNMWLGVLEKVKAHAYRTVIAIDKDPGVWPLTNDCGR